MLTEKESEAVGTRDKHMDRRAGVILAANSQHMLHHGLCELPRMPPAAHRLLRSSRRRFTVHDSPNPLEALLYKPSDSERHVVRETSRDNEVVAIAGHDFIFKDKSRPSRIRLGVIYGPEATTTGTLFDFDSFSGLHIK